VPGFFNEFGGCLIIGRWLDLLIELEGCLMGVRRCLYFFNELGGFSMVLGRGWIW
jgi:hypothetical protein